MIENAKVKEIIVSLSGVIPRGAYENLRPGFSMTLEPADGQSIETIFNSGMEYLHSLLDLEENRAKADLISKLYKHIRWYPRNNKKYPSVTSIIGYEDRYTKFGKFTDEELSQYASRGNIIEALINAFIKNGKWQNPNRMRSIKEDVAIIKDGSLRFDLRECSHKAFMDKFGDKIVVEEFQKVVYNDENIYAGTIDILGLYDGVKSVIDIKCGVFDMRQLAAYAICLEDIKQLVILPVGPTDNKCGYKKPVICDNIQKEFKEFLKARAKFRKRFGI